MSLYNMLFGMNPFSDILLKIIDKKRDDFPRFRDCYVEDDIITVYTRTGGGNRRCWDDDEDTCECPGCVMSYKIPNYKNYLKDYDDDFDETYAYIEFNVPKEMLEIFNELKLILNQEVETISEKFKKFIESLDKQGEQ